MKCRLEGRKGGYNTTFSVDIYGYDYSDIWEASGKVLNLIDLEDTEEIRLVELPEEEEGNKNE